MTRSLLCATVCKKCLDQAIPAMVEGLAAVSGRRFLRYHCDDCNGTWLGYGGHAVIHSHDGKTCKAEAPCVDVVDERDVDLSAYRREYRNSGGYYLTVPCVTEAMTRGLQVVSARRPSSSTRSGIAVPGTRSDADAVSGSWAGQSTSESERGLERRSGAKFQPAVKPGDGRSRMIAALLADTTAGWGELEAERRVDWWGQCAYAMGYGLRTLVYGAVTDGDRARLVRRGALGAVMEMWGR